MTLRAAAVVPPIVFAEADEAICTPSPTLPSAAEPAQLTPAVSVRKSVTPDYLICLDDGREFKSLKSFKGEFQEPLTLALAVYRVAKVRTMDRGLLLAPSPPPITR